MVPVIALLSRETVESAAIFTGTLLEAAGIFIILVGAIGATGVFINALLHRHTFHESFEGYRRHLGRGILLGLEFLIAADIIGTVFIELTFYNVGVLGILILVRTFLSIALTVEVEGRWPWQSPDGKTERVEAHGDVAAE